MIALRPFSPDMQEAVMRFLSQVFPESGKVFEPEGRHAAFADIERNFVGFWCLTDGDEVIGTVAVKKLSNEVCELKGMYLFNKYHGQGLGRRLAEAAIDFARKMGFGKMVLDTISTYEKALRLYKKLGFAPTERYNNNEKADIFMSKIL
ncbi:MAG: GNAT family N-acetyltransferase [Ruminococcus sp.]|uniref:GNAT family N-acetyltransferase n=1 Tax=Ruminococcus sp. TaxID=41978 RepID=UPI0025F8501A|nr:GNAT family N-acetyltransferase [Ruminococcus sp.]MCR4794461.1 GNAT family N-acetyltransferase [Ruminococcus sp.]